MCFEPLPNSLSLTTAVIKVCVIKTNNASITDHKPVDIESPGQRQDTEGRYKRKQTRGARARGKPLQRAVC